MTLFVGCGGIRNPTPVVQEINYEYKDPDYKTPLTGLRMKGYSPILELPLKNSRELIIGFYNTMKISAENVTIVIDNCIDSSSGKEISYQNEGNYPVIVESPTQNVNSEESAEFEITIENNLLLADTYICKLKAISANDMTKEYESLTFFMKIMK
jgi:hypothetical protein